MAAASDRTKAPYPQSQNLYHIRLGTHILAGDTAGYKSFQQYTAQFDFNVRQAILTTQEGSFAVTGGMLMKLVTDTGPQTIIAERSFVTTDDAGSPVSLTVADAGPVVAGEVLDLQMDSNTSDALKGINIDLWVEPLGG